MRKSLSGHDNSTETFYKVIYKELTCEEGECREISLSHSEGTKGSQYNALITALLLKQTNRETFSHITYFQVYNMQYKNKRVIKIKTSHDISVELEDRTKGSKAQPLAASYFLLHATFFSTPEIHHYIFLFPCRTSKTK